MSLDVELARFVLLVSVVVASVLYARTQRVTGGTFTPGYIAVLLFAREWEVLVSLVVFTVLTLAVMRLVVLRWAVLTRPWVYGIGVVVSTTSHALLRGTAGWWSPDLGITLFVVAGLYVTPGLIAYDLLHQGIRKTIVGISLGIVVTSAIAAPVLLLGFTPKGPTLSFQGRIDPGWWWLGVTVAVWATLALRMARGLATAGYIGSLFLVEVARWDTILILLACVVAARIVTAPIVRRLILTPRQRFQFSAIVGMGTVWTAMYWGQRMGIDGATALGAFTLEPLIIVGLVNADLARVGVWRSAVGTLAAVTLVAVAVGATALAPPTTVLVLVLVLGSTAVIARPALRDLFHAWRAAARTGRAVRPPAVSEGTRPLPDPGRQPARCTSADRGDHLGTEEPDHLGDLLERPE